jgi:hypothetical protein
MLLYTITAILVVILTWAVLEAITEYVRVRDYEIQRGKEGKDL